VVVDDGLRLPDRKPAGDDDGAQAPGHGHQGEGLQVRVQLGRHVAGGLGGAQLGGYHVGHRVGVLGEGLDRQRRIG
jgi:hypothetical protein